MSLGASQEKVGEERDSTPVASVATLHCSAAAAAANKLASVRLFLREDVG